MTKFRINNNNTNREEIVSWLENRVGFKQFSVEYYSTVIDTFRVFLDNEDIEYNIIILDNTDMAMEFALRFL